MSHSGVVVHALLILSILTVITSAEVVLVHDGATLIKYLCPPSGTLPPNTNLVIGSSLQLPIKEDQFCLVENTSNISIAASEELLNSEESYVTVTCERDTGFGFFNVSHLTIRSVYFKNCDHVIPETAVRYINGTNQFLFYNNDVRASLIFNHCFNITLYNVLVDDNPDITYGIIGVNLCGLSTISTVVPGDSPKSSMLIYFADSLVSSMCNATNSISLSSSLKPKIFKSTVTNIPGPIEHMIISIFSYYSLSLYLTQIQFSVSVDMVIPPTPRSETDLEHSSINMLILFLNTQTSSHVTYQGYPHDVCIDENSSGDVSLVPVVLSVVFLETPSFYNPISSIVSPLLIRDTAFITDLTFQAYSIFSIHGFPRMTSYLVIIDNVTWCKSARAKPDKSGIVSPLDYFYVGEYWFAKSPLLHIEMNDILILNDIHYYDLPTQHIRYSMHFFGVNVSFSGTNIFFNSGAYLNCIHVENSNLTLSGNFTVKEEHSSNFGILRLRGLSVLFLKEPLVASFSNNTIKMEDLINAPINENLHYSSIQILPINKYSSDNVTEIDISLNFNNNTIVNKGRHSSLRIPMLNNHWKQLSPNFLFEADTWDNRHDQYVYTTLIDSIFKEIDDYDKYTSLSNGICIQFHGQPPWKCFYVDQLTHSDKPLFNNSIHLYPGGLMYAVPRESQGDFQFEIRPFHNIQFYIQDVWNTTVYSNWLFYCLISETSSSALLKYKDNSLVNISLNSFCPIGFKLNRDCYCECIPTLQVNNYLCDISSVQLTSPLNYWTKLIEHDDTATVLVSSNCPPNYCNLTKQTISLEDYDPGLFCLGNRNGIMCGECKENYSAVFGSDDCYSHCTYLYLLTFPVYALAGLLLVVLLFGLRLTVATGTINGVIFYANMIGLVMEKLTENHSGTLLSIIRVLISLLNLELGFPLCFYKGMTPAAKIGFQFIFPLYLWSIVFGLVILSKYSIRVSRLILHSSVQVLATLFYLSYSKLVRIPITIVSYSTIQSTSYYLSTQYPVYSNTKVFTWFYNGADYGSGVHKFYLFLATFSFLFFLLPYVIFATFFYYLIRFKVVNKFRPFIDANGGPFKDKWRFWFGLRLWITIVLYSIDGALQGTHFDTMLILHLVIIGVFLFIQAVYCPFKNSIIRSIDLFYMINYIFITASYLLIKPNGVVFIHFYTCLVLAAILVTILTILYQSWCILKDSKCVVYLRIRYARRYADYELIGNFDAASGDEDDDFLNAYSLQYRAREVNYI